MAVEIVRRDVWVPPALRLLPGGITAHFNPKTEFGRYVRECLRFLPAEMAAELVARISRIVVVESSLEAVRHRWDDRLGRRIDDDFGVVSRKVVTDTGVGFIVDAFQNIVELEIMKFHGIGTGTVNEAAGDTALGTELTTEYNPDSTRATGSLTEGATSNIYKTVGTNTLDSGTPAITEHGILSQAATGGGVLLDRSKFAAINLVGANADALTTTYQLTLTSGG